MEYPVYIIYSSWSLKEIKAFLNRYGHSVLRVEWQQQHETNRTIALLSKDTYQKLVDAGYGTKTKGGVDFSVKPYVLSHRDRPKEEGGPGVNKSLTVIIPLKLTSEPQMVKDILRKKMELVTSWGLVASGDWDIKVPLKSRVTGQTSGKCYIQFTHKVFNSTIGFIRIIINDTYWSLDDGDPSINTDYFRCYWSKPREPREPRNKKYNNYKNVTQLDSGSSSTSTTPLPITHNSPITPTIPHVLEAAISGSMEI